MTIIREISSSYVHLIAAFTVMHASSCEDTGSSTLPPCTLETGLAPHLEGVTVLECATPECVIDASASGGPFVYRHDIEGIDSIVAMAFVRSEAGGPIFRVGFDSDPSGGSLVGSRVSQYVCASVTLNADCRLSGENSDCLFCNQNPENEYALICQGPPGPD